MFYLTRERQELFDVANTYPFDEEVDEEFKEDSYAYLTTYIHHVPEQFRASVLNHTLFNNRELMVDFEKWCYEIMEEFTTKTNNTYDVRKSIVASLSPSAQKIFSQSLHDGQIIHIAQTGSSFTLLLDMRSGFTVEAMVELVFHDAQTDGKLAGYYIYDELIQTEEGFALRVLSSSGVPYEEWTIHFQDVTATSLYRPAIYSEPGKVKTWEDYVAALPPEDNYYIVENYCFIEIDIAQFSKTEEGIFVGEILLGETFEVAKERIYCATYENPYAYLSEPISTDELLPSLFDLDQNIRVRAFNTIFELGAEVAPIVNEALRKADVNDEDSMLFSVLANHFKQLGCLNEDIISKWLTD